MLAFVTLARVVGDFVLVEAVGREKFHGASEEAFLGGFVTMKVAGAELLKKFRVFLVSQAVCGHVVGRFADGFFEVCLPFFGGLIWDGEHEVYVNRGEPCFSQDAEAFVGLVWGMDSSEGGEGFWVPRLDAKANAGDAGLAEEGCFVWAEGGGVCFEGPLLDLGEIDSFGEFLEEDVELFDSE